MSLFYIPVNSYSLLVWLNVMINDNQKQDLNVKRTENIIHLFNSGKKNCFFFRLNMNNR